MNSKPPRPYGEQDVRRRAYDIWQSRGGGPGREIEDWVRAERELATGTLRVGNMSVSLGDSLDGVEAALAKLDGADAVGRLWKGDASLWTRADESKWLGWLTIAGDMLTHLGELEMLGADVKKEGFRHVVLLGMGGSSLCPDVLRRTFGAPAGIELRVLDSTVPEQVRNVERGIDLAKTLFIVSSKSGSTVEPNVFFQHFLERVKTVSGSRAAKQFVVVTDPGSKLEALAMELGVRWIMHGVPSIGGRYSALSAFGMVPAAAIGLDVRRFLSSAAAMATACGPAVKAWANPGVLLGAAMGTLAKNGRDKVTFVASPKLASLGAWIEQLIAESTGKIGRGIVPVDGEPTRRPDQYGSDRLFAYTRLDSEQDDPAVDALERAGHPVVRIVLRDAYDLGQEFFRWEVATAIAGSIIGINAFDQPDVEAAKVAARTLMATYERDGRLPEEMPLFREGDLALFADPKNATSLGSISRSRSIAGFVAAHFARVRPGDYIALTAYVEMSAENQAMLQELRRLLAPRRVATTLGFGPRFLHSTGQLHKGGPNTGVFLQITCDDVEDVPIPGQKYTFGVLKRAQAAGDFEVLAQRDRRLVRLHLGRDVEPALARLCKLVQDAG